MTTIIADKPSMVREDPGEAIVYDQRGQLWFQEAVFYEVYVRAFCDSNGDGRGDLQGLMSKLDYLHSLGVDCVWLLPIYPSPLRDDGYDVADYIGIHEHFGNLEDFKALVNAVHERTMRIIIDFVPNHTSDQHWWFQEARKSRDNPYRDYYVWSDTNDKYKDARIIFVDTEPSNWTWDEVAGQYFWHRFFSSQPDLNFENPKVQEEVFNILKFWLRLGVDGFRVDAVPYLFESEGTNCENLPATHVFLKKMRAWIDQYYPGRVLLAEACQLPNAVREYFGDGDGDEFHMGFHFPVMPHIYMSMAKRSCSTLKKILMDTPLIPPKCQWVTFLRNHDELTLEMVTPEERQFMWQYYAPNPRMKINMGIRRRLAPLLDNDRRKIELAHSLLFTLPGSPILYYGDEIGMGDNIWLPDRNGVRTPMQWEPEHPTAGFSTLEDPKALYAPINSEPPFSKEFVNVVDAQRDPGSLFYIIKFMIRTRRRHQSFGKGKLIWIDNDENSDAVATYIREYGIDAVLVVCNVSEHEQAVTVPLTEEIVQRCTLESRVIREELTGLEYPIDPDNKMRVRLSPYQFLWLDIGERDTFA
jgi:maltose alpha-D-glucosyltransferase/alpha-amylase